MFLDKLFKNKFAIQAPKVEKFEIAEVEDPQDDQLLTASYSKFTVRTKVPVSTDKFIKNYNTAGNGGVSYCVVGNPTYSQANVLSNCVGYANGRFNEIYNEIMGTTGNHWPHLNVNAEYFINTAKKYYPDLQIGKVPKPGCIMVWQGAGSLAGHVAICEKVIDDNTIYKSESCYGGGKFFYSRATNDNGRWGCKSTYPFLGCIYNPAVVEQQEVTDPVKADWSVNQIYTTTNTLRVRKQPSLTGEIIGFVKAKSFYNYYEVKRADNYWWYRIDEDQWCADCGSITVFKALVKLKKGDKVKIMDIGNSRADGKGSVSRGIGYTRIVLEDCGLKAPYRFKIGTSTGNVTGFYSMSALKKLNN